MKSPFPLSIVALVAAVLLLSGTSLGAQGNQPHAFAAKAIYDGQYVRLRWSPTSFASWKLGITHGYDIERYTLRYDGVQQGMGEYEASKVVLATGLKPLPESAWQTYALANDLAGVAAGCLYGDSLDLLPPGRPNIGTLYNKSKESENRFGFSLFAADQDFTVATMMGLALVDSSDFSPGQGYVYVIKSPELESKSEVYTKGIAYVETDTAFLLPAPVGLNGSPGDSSAILSWQKDREMHSSYVMEKSSDGGATYVVLNDAPLVHSGLDENGTTAVFVDSLAANGVAYVYRVRGRSPFGLLSPPSDTVHVMGKPAPLSVLMSLKPIEEVTTTAITLTWEFPANQQGMITGFDLYRAPDPDGPYTKLNTVLLPVTQRSFTDAAPQPLNYYQLRCTDLNGYTLVSFPMMGQPKDEVPPPTPLMVSGVCDGSGLVTLKWRNSTATDVQGYQVLYSNLPNAEFVVISTALLNDTIFRYRLNLNTLSEDVYLRLKRLP